MVAGTTPETVVFPVEPDRIDQAGGSVFKTQGITHLPEFAPDPVRSIAVEQNVSRFGFTIFQAGAAQG